MGLFNHPCVVGSECLRQLVFLTLLEQIEIKGFLHFLLAFHRKQVFGLTGVGGKTLVDFALRALQAGQLVIERHQLVVDAGNNDLTQICKVLIQVEHQWVFLTTVSHQTVAA